MTDGPGGIGRTETQRHQRGRLEGAMVAAVAKHGYTETTVGELVGLTNRSYLSPGQVPIVAVEIRSWRGLGAARADDEGQAAGNTLPIQRTFMEATTLTEQLWGGETTKAVDNFPVSGEPVPVPVVRWLGRLKARGGAANAELGALDADVAERIAAAGDAVAAGEHDDQFPIDVFQTGSGTSSNMNANEVIANLAGDGAHPNDHVNMGQSSNDVFPSAVHLAALDEVDATTCCRRWTRSRRSLEAKASEFADVVKAGRTHLMDAVPVTLGQEFGGYAAQVRLGVERVEATLRQVGQIPLGGTATGTGLNTHPEFAEQGAREAGRGHRPRDLGAARPASRRRATATPWSSSRGAEGRRGLADQDRQRPRADGLRPARRARRDAPAGAAEGLVDHARQGQPGDPARS